MVCRLQGDPIFYFRDRFSKVIVLYIMDVLTSNTAIPNQSHNKAADAETGMKVRF